MIQSSLYNLLKTKFKHDLLITKDPKEAQKCENLFRFFGYDVFLFPDLRAEIGDDLRAYQHELFQISINLNRFFASKKSKKVLISPIRTALHKLPIIELIDKKIELFFGDRVDINAFKDKLFYWGYSFVDIVEVEGEVSIRGDIIDIYPINLNRAIRISLFDVEIESIREFDLSTQMCSKDELESIEIFPAFFGLDEEKHKILEERVKDSKYDVFYKDIPSLGLWHLQEYSTCYLEKLNPILTQDSIDEIDEIFDFGSYEIEKSTILNLPKVPQTIEDKDFTPSDIDTFLKLHKDKKITILSKNEAILKQYGIDPNATKYKIVESNLIVNILGKDELIVSLNREEKSKKRRKSSIIIDELKPHDYVVHEDYGVGIYEGIVKRNILGAKRDFVSIAYQGEDKLLVPVENLGSVDRYIADSGSIPILDKLGKGSFVKLKDKVKKKLFEIAGEIIKIAAKRELIEGIKVDSSLPELEIFENSSGFEYTDDQKKSIEEINRDLSSGRVMDRLLSGDVGFGKTEVAMNAIYTVVKNGYQALFLAPTTLLSHQHFLSLKKRFLEFGIKVGKIDRFVPTKQKNDTLQKLQDGSIDVVIGTHTLLNVKCKKLALVIVDEEHKFGVKQKEKIKEISADVHLLSMSATPIPRTLNMALSTIKGLSTILTPPQERLPVRTFVKEHSDELIKEIISRELRRGGQIFYIHNNIATIELKKAELKKIYSGIKIATLHSKIDSKESEEIMFDFEEGRHDMLLSTSIVESGIHLPNANTMIVDGSDRFGIADLHQLRGRVGRGKKEGFCYFLIEERENITPEAKKRLLALENNSFLGSGSVLAYHDLEIRGGGNLIGEAQSGHIKNIGYSLYLRMLEDSINTLSGKESIKRKDVDIKLAINAYISPELISSDRIRLELYRRLSSCKNAQEIYEIEEEMIDRFGRLDDNTLMFISLMIIKILAIEKEIKTISSYNQNITFFYEDGSKDGTTSKSKDDDDILYATLEFLRR